MTRPQELVAAFLIGFSVPAVALDVQSAEDAVYINVTPETMELDEALQAAYRGRYDLEVVSESPAYEPMKLIAGEMPPTPADADGKPITGRVLVGFVLNVDGTLQDPVVLQSADERLSEVAKAHVLELSFLPAKFDSKVVRAIGAHAYDFD